MWYAKGNKSIANILAAAPIVALRTEWYITGRENILLLTFYIGMIVCLLIYVPKKAKRCLPVILIAAGITLVLIRAGWMDLIYGGLLNI